MPSRPICYTEVKSEPYLFQRSLCDRHGGVGGGGGGGGRGGVSLKGYNKSRRYTLHKHPAQPS